MKVIDNLPAWHDWRRGLQDQTLGFVPTMGALHAGHQSLLQRSVAENQNTVLSIYLNATQFNDPKDLAAYPETLEADLQMAKESGVSAVLLPTYGQIYPDDYRFQVDETKFSKGLCGADRPGHFTGVLTVVMKLLNLVTASACVLWFEGLSAIPADKRHGRRVFYASRHCRLRNGARGRWLGDVVAQPVVGCVRAIQSRSI